MQSADPRTNEVQSLLALRDLDVLDSAPEAEFDALVRAASLVCGVPVALISLIDADRQWFKANLGLPGVSQTPRELAFCAHAVLHDELFEVPDATLDPRFADNPLVVGRPDIRFYAGAPLRLSDGHRVGTLCVIDQRPRQLTDAQREVLQSLAVAAVGVLEGRKASRALKQITRENERRLRGQYESTPAMLHSIDAQGRLIAVSDAWLTRLGYTRDEVLGRASTDFLTPASREHARQVVLPAFFASGRCDAVEYQAVARDGEVIDVLLSATLECGPGGEPLRSLAVMEDVTLRRRAERALELKGQRLASIIDGAQTGTWEWNVQTGEVLVNDQWAQIVGMGVADLSPVPVQRWQAEVHPDDLDRSTDAMRRHLDGRSDRYVCETRVRHLDGHWVWVIDRGRVTTWTAEGQPQWVFGTRRDISDRKQQEAALRKSEAFLDRTGRLAGVGGWEVDIAAGEVTWSDETCRIHGVPSGHRPALAEAIEFYAPEARPVIQAALETAMATGETWDLELPLIRADGQRIWARAMGAVEFEGGTPVRLIGAFQDITQRRATEEALRELMTIFDNTTDFVVQTDDRGSITYMNPSVRRATGLAPDEVVTHRHWAEFSTPQTNQLFAQTIMPAVRAGRVWVGETTLRLAHDREVPLSHMVIAHRDATGQVEHYSSVMRDISADVEAKLELLRQTATLRSVTEAIPATVAVVGVDGRYRFVNGAFERWWGRPGKRILGYAVRDVLGDREFERRKPWVERALAGESVDFVLDHPSSDGTTHVAISYVPLRLDTGEADGFVVVTQDVTAQKREEQRLLNLSLRDPLTGLLNRAGFEQQLQRFVQEEPGASRALLYIDLDHFKPVNDRFGHAAGDQILQIFAKRLVNLVRPTDAVARLGGDEFAIALSGARELANAKAIADKVLAAANAPFNVGAMLIEVGASVGVAFDAEPDSGWQDLVDRADAKLLTAKAQGRGRQSGVGG